MIRRIVHSDCLDELKKLPADYIDLLVTDPPYGYSFMGKDWDKAVPSVELWQEVLRVLKPGSFAFVMSAPRSDVQCAMIERMQHAGFRMDFTPIYWTYASGFPKAMNIGKMVDKRNGSKRKVVSVTHKTPPATNNYGNYGNNYRVETTRGDSSLEGSYGGFQPKPAVEVILVAMKPLSEKTYVDQALENGKGITWLDDCRIPTQRGEDFGKAVSNYGNKVGGQWQQGKQMRSVPPESGRFPANLLVSDDVLNDHSRFFSLDAWAETLPFLAVPKASKREKNEGLQHLEERQVTGGGGLTASVRDDGSLETASAGGKYGSVKAKQHNFHPTVKPLTLMSYLITLGSREGDLVLDPFVGSGTTALAAHNLNRQYIGIEQDKEYVEIAKARLQALQPKLLAA